MLIWILYSACWAWSGCLVSTSFYKKNYGLWNVGLLSIQIPNSCCFCCWVGSQTMWLWIRSFDPFTYPLFSIHWTGILPWVMFSEAQWGYWFTAQLNLVPHLLGLQGRHQTPLKSERKILKSYWLNKSPVHLVLDLESLHLILSL